MKKLLLAMMLFSMSVPALAVHCNCVELERRLRGLDNALYYAPISSEWERQEIKREMYKGNEYYRQGTAYGTSLNDQERLCSLGAVAVDNSWRRWQPWLAQNGYDHATYCENPGPGNGQVPYNGDTGCPQRSWRTYERTRQAIIMREGAQNLNRFNIVQIYGSSCLGYVPRYN